MTRISSLFTSTALATLFAFPATAGVSANEVWDGISAYYSAIGLRLDATPTQTGNCRITDYQAKATGDPDNFTITYRLEQADMELGNLNITGPTAREPGIAGNFTFAAHDISGETGISTDDLMVAAQNSRMGAFVANGKQIK